MTAVRLADVRRIYAGRAALDGVSLTLSPGRVCALLGASGSGKSTLLRLLAGLEAVDGGEIRFGEAVVSAPGFTREPEHRGVGLVFQDFALFPHLTVRDNVAFGLNRLAKPARARAAEAMIARVGLSDKAVAYPHMLSGGEQQRVALARALAPRPLLVLLDEPFSGLDPALRAQLRDDTLALLAETGAAALFVTHDSEEALYVADDLAILKAGRLVQAGPPREIYDAPASVDAAGALGAINVARVHAYRGRAETPFGAFPTNAADGTRIDVVVRAEALRLAPGEGARVRAVKPQGDRDLVLIEAGGLVWRALTPRMPRRCDNVSVTVERAYVFMAS